jgi:UDP-2,3-diacylglucosamine hydrolase
VQPTPPPLLPRFVELHADDSWRSIEFISDLHLSEATPHTTGALQRYLDGTDADAVFILGDLFEVWVGDDARHDRFEAECAEMLAAAACQRTIGFMHGNRDFLVGLGFLKSCGMTALADPTVLSAFGQRLLLTHGDALCLADTEYQAFRTQVRSEAWQSAFLGRTLAARRQIAREMRERSRARHRQRKAGDWADVDPAAAVQWEHLSGAPVMVHGHTHRPGTELLAPGFLRHVLSDWHLEPDGQPLRAEVLRWTADGLTRRSLLPAVDTARVEAAEPPPAPAASTAS